MRRQSARSLVGSELGGIVAPVALVRQKLYALGGTIPLDGRVSWVPHVARGYQPISCYLLLEDQHALLIDTGLPIHLTQIARQLDSFAAEGRDLSIYLTRAEMDCVGNVASLTNAFTVKSVWTGGAYNPFDGFDQLTANSRGEHDEPVIRLLPGESIHIGLNRRLEVLLPPLRMLTSYWAYDTGTSTLFTSDVFGYGATEFSDYEVIRNSGQDHSDLSSVRAYLEAKYWWLPVVDSLRLVRELDVIFSTRKVARIAPTHGFVLEGDDLVAKHYHLLRQLLTKSPNT